MASGIKAGVLYELLSADVLAVIACMVGGIDEQSFNETLQ